MKKMLLAVLAGLTLASACKKDDETTPTMELSATMTGSSEAPTVTSSGTGTVSGTYDPSSKLLKYTITYSGITPTAGHIHYGKPGRNGDVAIPLTSLTSPINGSLTLTALQADSLKAGRMYANLHTTANPAGELRGNMTVK